MAELSEASLVITDAGLSFNGQTALREHADELVIASPEPPDVYEPRNLA